MSGLIGRKVGMSQIFEDNGIAVPVTVLEVGPCPVVEVKSTHQHGYSAVQLAYDPIPGKRLSKARLEHLKTKNVEPHRTLREFRTDEAFEPGTVLDVSMFQIGDRVDVIGKTKGRGFQGVVKRHGYHGGKETHGCKTHAVPGSIGMSATPARVLRGKKLPGHMGNHRKTIKNLKVVKVDSDRNLLIVRGAVPGSRNSLVLVRKTRKVQKKG
ncbi:MAG: 50S ribosomal protein L3 [Candidatus Eisenbacteria sp.]|nr:50S ribosomal protein L3 [Candidatus Eisenbacteria bacterium]